MAAMACPCLKAKGATDGAAAGPSAPAAPPPPKPCTPEQVAELSNVVVKEMMVLVVKPSVETPADIVVPPPKMIADLKIKSAGYRTYGDPKVLEGEGEATEEPEGAAEGEPEKKGMFAGMKDKAANAAGAAADAAGGAKDAVVKAGLNTIADGLDGAVDKVEKPFAQIGSDIVTAKGPEILEVLKEAIGTSLTPEVLTAQEADVRDLVRGKTPWGKAELDALNTENPGAITQFLMKSSRAGMIEKLKPICEETIKKHTITTTWNTFNDSYNSLCGKVDALNIDALKMEPMKLDIDDYIVGEVIEQIGAIMAKEEASIRAAPAGKSTRPSIFEDLFGGVVLNETHYKKLIDTE